MQNPTTALPRTNWGGFGRGRRRRCVLSAAAPVRPRGHSVVYVLTCLYPNGVLLRFYFGLRHLAWRFASQVLSSHQPPY
ncbi:hypothetical protein JTE90_021968 [Oedothorax gibbosus]|uniref:Uncharacterized protein n=1 Tax=Oedothorax gibbosus TaxID=931172 RepID=A0AAV6V3M6_9ARAC|nr:hypothetical protein JTE90_021968 [Oedothorax gibbosus]